jgi:hypothetical protein
LIVILCGLTAQQCTKKSCVERIDLKIRHDHTRHKGSIDSWYFSRVTAKYLASRVFIQRWMLLTSIVGWPGAGITKSFFLLHDRQASWLATWPNFLWIEDILTHNNNYHDDFRP